jgi:hypothetical protein
MKLTLHRGVTFYFKVCATLEGDAWTLYFIQRGMTYTLKRDDILL